jgi:hypothetical protein
LVEFIKSEFLNLLKLSILMNNIWINTRFTQASRWKFYWINVVYWKNRMKYFQFAYNYTNLALCHTGYNTSFLFILFSEKSICKEFEF